MAGNNKLRYHKTFIDEEPTLRFSRGNLALGSKKQSGLFFIQWLVASNWGHQCSQGHEGGPRDFWADKNHGFSRAFCSPLGPGFANF